MAIPVTWAAARRAYIDAIEAAIEAGCEDDVYRELALTDLFFLLVFVLGRKDANRPWLFDRCREVQNAPNNHLDLWAREHFKSTIITFALTIQDILRDPEITVGIFSFNRPTAKAFLIQIMREFKDNERLRALFPDVLWENPQRDAPKWSEDAGIIVKRKGNPKESTIEAWGLVDGQPTSKHFRLRIYDDVVTADSVTSSEMIEKVTRAWEASLNLGTENGIARYIGTRWHSNDTYRQIISRGTAIERRHPVTFNGQVDGEPVLWSRELVAEKRRDMGPYTFGAQMLLDPAADRVQGFKEDWLRFHDVESDAAARMNKYLLCDPANSKKKQSDYSAFVVIGLGEDGNYYLLDAVRDRLSLSERAERVFTLHRKWRPLAVGYEQYGMSADAEYIRQRMKETNYNFELTEVGGQLSKPDRIRRMVPVFEAKRFYLKENLHRVDYEGRMINITQSFIDDEYLPFPVALHDDLFDAIARIWDIETQWPMPSHSGRLRSGGMRSDYHPIESWDQARGGGRSVAGTYRPY